MGTNAWKKRREAIRPPLSMSELGRRSGVDKSRISYIEKGVPPTPDQAAALLRALEAAERDQAEEAASA